MTLLVVEEPNVLLRETVDMHLAVSLAENFCSTRTSTLTTPAVRHREALSGLKDARDNHDVS